MPSKRAYSPLNTQRRWPLRYRRISILEVDYPLIYLLDGISRLIIQDKTHENECDVDILENHEKDVSRSECSIRSTHTARQNNKNQKEIPLIKSELDQRY